MILPPPSLLQVHFLIPACHNTQALLLSFRSFLALVGFPFIGAALVFGEPPQGPLMGISWLCIRCCLVGLKGWEGLPDPSPAPEGLSS